MRFGHPSEYHLVNVGPCRLRPVRHAVPRLPGLPLARSREIVLAIPQILSWTSHPLQGLIQSSTALRLVGWRTSPRAFGAAPMDFRALQRMKKKRPFAAGLAISRQSPSIAFLRFQRAGPEATFPSCRVCFAPTTLLGFRLQGFVPSRDPEPVSGPDPPLPLTSAHRNGRRLDCEGLIPLERGTRCTRHISARWRAPALLVFLPSEALPSAAGEPDFSGLPPTSFPGGLPPKR
jgi:hypothetical protein